MLSSFHSGQSREAKCSINDTFHRKKPQSPAAETVELGPLAGVCSLYNTIHPPGVTSDEGQLSVLCSFLPWSQCAGSVAGPQRWGKVHRSACTQEGGRQCEGRSQDQGQGEGSGVGFTWNPHRGCWNRYCQGRTELPPLFLLEETPQGNRWGTDCKHISNSKSEVLIRWYICHGRLLLQPEVDV